MALSPQMSVPDTTHAPPPHLKANRDTAGKPWPRPAWEDTVLRVRCPTSGTERSQGASPCGLDLHQSRTCRRTARRPRRPPPRQHPPPTRWEPQSPRPRPWRSEQGQQRVPKPPPQPPRDGASSQQGTLREGKGKTDTLLTGKARPLLSARGAHTQVTLTFHHVPKGRVCLGSLTAVNGRGRPQGLE